MARITERLLPEIKKYSFFVLGNLLYAVALQMFFLKNNIAAGGFAGIATVLNSLVPVSVGWLVFIMTIPFLVWSLFAKGWRYTLVTFSATLVYAILQDLVSFLPCATDNLLMASLFGGLLYALGAVCMLKADASGGGTDLVARLLMTKFRNLSLGSMFMIVDGFTVIFAVVVYKNLELGLAAILAIYTCSVFTDKLITGFKYASICYVITSLPPEEMSGAIMSRMRRGVTCQRGVGMFEKSEKNVLMVVVKPKEMYKLKDIIQEFDPGAFVVVAYANEVQGGGFQAESGHYSLSVPGRYQGERKD